jgi:multiple sugar transport system substrate-binding protein
MNALQWKGQQLALPLGGGPTMMYYNVNAFKKAGLTPPPTDWNDTTWTWDKMVQDAKLLTLDSSGRNATDPKFDYKHTVQWGVNGSLGSNDAWAWLWGCNWFPTDIGLPAKNLINTPCVIDSLQKAADLANKYHVAPNQIQQQLFKLYSDPFNSGKIAMGISGVWFMENVSTGVKNRFPWGIAAIPLGKTRTDVLYTDPMMIAHNSPHPQEAFQFVKFLTSKEGQNIFINGYVGLSMRKSLLNLADLKSPSTSAQSTADVHKVILGAFVHGRESSNHQIAQWAAIANLTDAELAPMWNGQKTAAQVAQVIQPKLDALLQQNIKRYGSGQ